MLKGIHNTKVHKDCPFDIETLDEFRNDRLRRLKQLHAMALGLYMGFRLNGQDGQVQKQRMERLAKEIQRLDPTIESVQSVQSVFRKIISD